MRLFQPTDSNGMHAIVGGMCPDLVRERYTRVVLVSFLSGLTYCARGASHVDLHAACEGTKGLLWVIPVDGRHLGLDCWIWKTIKEEIFSW